MHDNPPSMSVHNLPAGLCYYTVGCVSQIFQQPPDFVTALARDAGVQPVCVFNGVPQFNGPAVEIMAAFMKRAVQAAEAAPNN